MYITKINMISLKGTSRKAFHSVSLLHVRQAMFKAAVVISVKHEGTTQMLFTA